MDHQPNLHITIPKTSTEDLRPPSLQNHPHFQSIHLSPRDSLATLVDASSSTQNVSVWEPNTPDYEKALPKVPRRSTLTILIIESTILVIAATTLGLASAYGIQLMKAPRLVDLISSSFLMPDPASSNSSMISSRAASGTPTALLYDRGPKDSWNIWAVIYNGTMPVLSIIFALIGLLLALRKRVVPIYSMIISASFLAGWCVMLGWWVTCDWGIISMGDRAPNCKHLFLPFSILFRIQIC
jgi:hypothetical protein